MVNTQPLYFYHFSGFDSGSQRAMLDKYGSRMPALYELRDWYIAECARMGQEQWECAPWSYGYFDNGKPIRPAQRTRYRERADLQKHFPNPYSTLNPRKSYYHWFEADDENAMQPAYVSQVSPAPWPSRPAAKPSVTTGDPAYRIYVSTGNLESSRVIAYLKDLLEKTHRKSSIWIIGTQAMLDCVQSDAALGPVCGFEPVPDGASHEQAFTAAATRCGGEWDFVLIAASVRVPELWDLRLAWAAQRASGVATVSPINDAFPPGRLGMVAGAECVDRLDDICYQHSLLRDPDVPSFFESCFYVNRAVIGDLIAGAPGSVSFEKLRETCRRLRWSHVLADHVYTRGGTDPGPALPDSRVGPLDELRAQVSALSAAETGRPAASIRGQASRRQLHVLHNWGGGLDRWVTEYCRADHNHDNLILKSVGTWGAFGLELHLYRRINDKEPIRQWALSPGIKSTALTHSRYQAAIAEIVDRYGIDVVLISSLVGHSLDVLDSGLPTVMVCHDYYPFCPALNITFGNICGRCSSDDLHRCTEANPHHRFFRNVPPSEWEKLRKAFTERVLRSPIPLVAPSASVRKNYSELVPEIADRFVVIPHAARVFEGGPLRIAHDLRRRLRIVVLGSLAPHKGGGLLREIASQISSFGDLFLVGCGESGRTFEEFSNVTVIREYEWAELPGLLSTIRPDLGLLLSIVPETFSYTLHELMNLGVPPVATRLGSFADWVEDGVNGFLCDPTPSSVLSRLEQINGRRDLLPPVRDYLLTRARRTMPEMIADYQALLGLPDVSARAYYTPIDAPSGASEIMRFRVASRTGDGDFADATTKTVPCSSARQSVTIELPALLGRLSAMRLQLGVPGQLIGLFSLQLSSSDGKCLWFWESREGEIKGEFQGMQPLGGGPGLIVHLARDAQWILPVDPSGLQALADGGKLEIEFSSPAMDEVPPNLSALIVAGGHAGVSPAQRDAMLEFVQSRGSRSPVPHRPREASTDRLLQRLAEASARVEDLEQSLSWRITGPLRWLNDKLLHR